MTKAVLDANSLVSGVLVPHGIPSRLLDAAYARRFVCVSSDTIVDEVVRTLMSARIARKYRVDSATVDRLRALLESDEVATPITEQVRGVATPPEDDAILATAVSAGADYLGTGDRQLQKLGTYRGVRIVSRREFLQVLQADVEEGT